MGADDRHITTVDADGVALAAIQGLYQMLTDELADKQEQIRRLEERLAAVENRVE